MRPSDQPFLRNAATRAAAAAAARTGADAFGVGAGAGAVAWLLPLLAFAATILAGTFSYYGFERPFLRLKRRFGSISTPPGET